LHFQRVYPHYYAVRHCSGCCQALWLTDQAAFTKELVRTQERHDGLLPLLGHNRNFNFALFDIEDGICGVALCEKTFAFLVRGYGPALGGGRQKSRGIKSPPSRFGASVRFNFSHTVF
jgi:hypothetical protein